MDDITKSKHDIKSFKKNYLSTLLTKVLLSIIFILSSLIFTNYSQSNNKLFKDKVLDNNIKFNKYKKMSEKYLGKVLPVNSMDTKAVINNESIFDNIIKTDDGEKIILSKNTVINSLQSGIVVFIGKKDNLDNTIIIQGSDDVDIWYSNVTNTSVKLYDYVEKNKVIGESNEYMILNIIKDKEKISYEEYIKSI